MNIFVAKMNRNTGTDDLKRLFEAFGEVRSVKIIYDRTSGMSKGYGFIEMATEDAADLAIANLNKTTFQEAVIVVKKANPREETPPRKISILKRNTNDLPAPPQADEAKEDFVMPEE